MTPYVPGPWDFLVKQFVERRMKMKYFLVIVASLFILISLGCAMQTGSDAAAPSAQETEKSYATAPKPADAPATSTTARVYPIAPGVWYPGQGPLPEKPVRYYRARCWPGCHHGSSHGMYPDKPLNMEPIFPTSTIDLEPHMPAKN
jgi:hypothetical protein